MLCCDHASGASLFVSRRRIQPFYSLFPTACSLAPKEHSLARFTGVLGIITVLAAAWLGSTDRRRIRWRTIAWGLGLQLTFAFLVLRFDFGERAMAWAGDVVTRMLSATFAGTRILFGELGLPNAGAFGKVISPASAGRTRSPCGRGGGPRGRRAARARRPPSSKRPPGLARSARVPGAAPGRRRPDPSR